jgi:hypothetical protein
VTTGGDFGSGVSPIIVDDTVILVRDEMKEPKIVAIDVANGSPKWEKTRLSRASWCTPVVWETAAGKQVVAAGHVQMVGYDLASGAEQWTVTGLPSGCCTSPVASDGNLLFAGSSSGNEDGGRAMPDFDSLLKNLDKDQDGAISKAEGEQAFGGFFDNQDTNKDGKVSREEFETIVKFMSEGKNSAFALKPGGSGDITASHTIWKKTKGLPYIASAIAYGGRYVAVKDGGIVVACDTESGKQDYQERLGATGKYYASPVAASGHVYFTSLEKGGVTVLTVGGGKPTVAHSVELGERAAATPAIADDALYVRTADHLWAFAERK